MTLVLSVLRTDLIRRGMVNASEKSKMHSQLIVLRPLLNMFQPRKQCHRAAKSKSIGLLNLAVSEVQNLQLSHLNDTFFGLSGRRKRPFTFLSNWAARLSWGKALPTQANLVTSLVWASSKTVSRECINSYPHIILVRFKVFDFKFW